LADKEGLDFIYPKNNIYSMDNAAMVGINGYYKIKYKRDLGCFSEYKEHG
jgi:tRNA A37 threonylcarbamoyltransferase TsaD